MQRAIPGALGPEATPEGGEILLAALDQHRKLVDSLHKNAAAVVPEERVLAFVHAVTNLVLESCRIGA